MISWSQRASVEEVLGCGRGLGSEKMETWVFGSAEARQPPAIPPTRSKYPGHPARTIRKFAAQCLKSAAQNHDDK